MNPSAPLSSSPQVLRQLLSFDNPKLSLVKCDDDDRSSSLRRGGVLNKCDTAKPRGRLTTSASPCAICSTQGQVKDDQVICFSSEGHHRPILTSLLGGERGTSDEEDGWSLCPFCLSVVRRLTRLMDEVEDIKTRIKAVIKLAKTTEGSTFVDKPKGPHTATQEHFTTTLTTIPLAVYSHQHLGNDDDDEHPMNVQDDQIKNDIDHWDDEDIICEPVTCMKHEALIEDDGLGDHYEEAVIPEAEINGGRHDDPSSLPTGDPNPLPKSVQSPKYGKHRKYVDYKRPSPPCYFCQKTLNRVRYFANHLRTHTLERPYLCSDCGQDFRVSTDLKKHECPKKPSLHPPKPRLQCHLCGKTVKENSLRLHTRRAHKATKVDFQPSCGAKGYSCPEYGKTFTLKGSIRSHLQGVHLLDPSKKQNCPICHTGFNNKRVFQAHTHPDPKDSSNVIYICSICRKTYKTKTSYHHHWSTVHGDRAAGKCWQCEHCGKFFRQAASMNRHRKSCSVSPEEQRTCSVSSCGQVFATLFERLNHERVVHKGLSSMQCYFCSKTFGNTSCLQRHVRTHTRERPFRCLKCGKDFRIYETWRNHMARVCGEDERKKTDARMKKDDSKEPSELN